MQKQLWVLVLQSTCSAHMPHAWVSVPVVSPEFATHFLPLNAARAELVPKASGTAYTAAPPAAAPFRSRRRVDARSDPAVSSISGLKGPPPGLGLHACSQEHTTSGVAAARRDCAILALPWRRYFLRRSAPPQRRQPTSG